MSKYNCVVYYADIEVVVKKSRTEMKTVKVLTEKVPPGKVRSRLTIAQVRLRLIVYTCVWSYQGDNIGRKAYTSLKRVIHPGSLAE